MTTALCNNCTAVNLNCCSEQIVIGTPPDPLADYLLKIEDNSNGRIILLPISNDGLTMTVDVSEFNFASNHSYEFYLVSAGDVVNHIDWMIGTESVNCLSVSFIKNYDSDGHIHTSLIQTISL